MPGMMPGPSGAPEPAPQYACRQKKATASIIIWSGGEWQARQKWAKQLQAWQKQYAIIDVRFISDPADEQSQQQSVVSPPIAARAAATSQPASVGQKQQPASIQ